MPKTLSRIRNEDEAPPRLHCLVEEIAQAYLTSTAGDADIALRCAITDALSDLMQAERSNEPDGVCSHPAERRRHGPRRAGDAGVVEQDDLSGP